MNTHFALKVILFVGLTPTVALLAHAQENMLDAIKSNSTDTVTQTLLNAVQQVKKDTAPERILLNAIMTGKTNHIRQVVDPMLNHGQYKLSPITWATLLQKPAAVQALSDCGAKTSHPTFLAKCAGCKAFLLNIKKKIARFFKPTKKQSIRSK